MWWGTPQHVQGQRAEAAEAAKMAAAVPSLGAVPMDLDAKGQGHAGPDELHAGLRSLLENKECCDLVFIAGDEQIEAHAVVLAASSGSFCTFLRQNPSLGLSMSTVDSPKQMEDLFSIQPQEVQPDSPVESNATGQAQTEGTSKVDTADTSPADGAAMDQSETSRPEPMDQPEAAESSQSAPGEAGTVEEQPKMQPEVSETGQETMPKEKIEESQIEEKSEKAKEVNKEKPKIHINVNGLSSPEALHILLDYVYKGFGGADWHYNATNAQVNKDVLRLARNFGFSHLHEHAARWLVTGLTTQNVLERLVTCEEVGLGLLREKITQRLALNPPELMLVCSSPEITKHPKILQGLLVQVASLQDKPKFEDGEKNDDDEAEKENKENQQENKQDKHEEKAEKPKKDKQDKHKPTKAEKLAKQEKPQAEKQPAKKRKA